MGLLEIKNITYAYKSAGAEAVPVLRDVNFNVQPGELVAIQGPSGSGKSTLLYVLGCLLNPDRGRVLLDGKDVARMTSEDLAYFRSRTIGFVFQQFHLLARARVLDNILLPAQYPAENPRTLGKDGVRQRARALELAEQVGLSDRIGHLPNQLSGGQQQRVAIARALLNDPKIILADEPTGNLDSQNAAQIIELLRELSRQGRAVVIITHDPEIAAKCSRTVHIRDGVMQEEGSGARGNAPNVAGGATGSRRDPGAGRAAASAAGARVLAYLDPRRYFAMARNLAPQAISNLGRNRIRSALTMMGIVIGISAVLAMVTLGQFTKRKILESYESLGVNKLVLRGWGNWEQKATDKTGVIFKAFDWQKDLAPLSLVFPDVNLISPVMGSWNDAVSFGGVEITGVRTQGVSPDYSTITNREVLLGRFFNKYHVEKRSPVCLLGYEIASRLFKQVNPIGQIVYVTGNNNKAHTCQVVGVLKSQASNSEWHKPDLQLLMPYTFFPFVNEERDSQIREAVLQIDPNGDVEAHAKSIKAFFQQKYGKSGRFNVDSDAVLLAQMKRFLNLFSVLLGAISVISLVVGGIGITNMMLVSVSERLKEIGLRKAVGATDFSIRVQFLLEALVLCCVAGVLGLVFGFASYEALIYGASKVVPKVQFEWVVEPGALVLSVVSILVVGILSGLAPALKAERMEVIEALRSE